ncbi:MAG: hypothetical protein ACI4NA_06130 [Succinivibrio sp.]
MIVLLGTLALSFLMFMLLAGVGTTIVMALYACPIIIAAALSCAVQWGLWLWRGIDLPIPCLALVFLVSLAAGFLVLLLLKRRGVLTSAVISVRRVVR